MCPEKIPDFVPGSHTPRISSESLPDGAEVEIPFMVDYPFEFSAFSPRPPADVPRRSSVVRRKLRLEGDSTYRGLIPVTEDQLPAGGALPPAVHELPVPFMPLEWFDDEYTFEQRSPDAWLRIGRARGLPGTPAQSQFHRDDGTFAWTPCYVLEYREEDMRYLIEWRGIDAASSAKQKWVSRLNLMFDCETEAMIHARVAAAKALRSVIQREAVCCLLRTRGDRFLTHCVEILWLPFGDLVVIIRARCACVSGSYHAAAGVAHQAPSPTRRAGRRSCRCACVQSQPSTQFNDILVQRCGSG